MLVLFDLNLMLLCSFISKTTALLVMFLMNKLYEEDNSALRDTKSLNVAITLGTSR